MPRYSFMFRREVITHDFVERTIEAATLEAAQELADGMAGEFDRICPDDVAKGDDVQIERWEAAPADAVQEEI